jgi:hypothetical protein
MDFTRFSKDQLLFEIRIFSQAPGRFWSSQPCPCFAVKTLERFQTLQCIPSDGGWRGRRDSGEANGLGWVGAGAGWSRGSLARFLAFLGADAWPARRPDGAAVRRPPEARLRRSLSADRARSGSASSTRT